MNQHSEDATALLGMEGFVMLSQTEENGEPWILIETTADRTTCPRCGLKAQGHGRSQVPGL